MFINTETMQEMDYEMAQWRAISGIDDVERFVSASDFYAVGPEYAHEFHTDISWETLEFPWDSIVTVAVCHECRGLPQLEDDPEFLPPAMEIVSVNKSCFRVDPIVVTVANLGNATDSEVTEFAMAAAHEKRASLFGTQIARHDNSTASITLFRD